MIISYNNGSENVVERYGYRTPPEGKTWEDTITSWDTRTYNDLFSSDDYWPIVTNFYYNSTYPYFEDLYGDPMIHCYGGTTLKVPDLEYPYRSFQLASNPLWIGCVSSHFGVYMWKSKDGIIFEQCRFIDLYQNTEGDIDERFEKDGTIDAILHGNIIKLYTRWRPYTDGGFNKRQLGVGYVDIDGNNLTPSHHLIGEDHLYIAAASNLDDRRDILFPTYITSGILPTSIKCFIIDGNRYSEVILPDDFSEGGNIKQQYVANHAIIPIQNFDKKLKFYIIYEAATYAHDLGPHSPGFDYDSNNAFIKIREISFNVQ